MPDRSSTAGSAALEGWPTDTRAQPEQALSAAHYFGPPARPDPGIATGAVETQAFLVDMGPGASLRTHFHPVDQFQVFIAGSGRFGRHDVGSGTLHYADRYTPYGPLHAGEGGTAFLTLRAQSDSGAFYMPDSRSALAKGLEVGGRDPRERRSTTFAVDPTVEADRWHWYLTEADGLRIGSVRLAASAEDVSVTVQGAGAFLVVLDGKAAFLGDVESAADGRLGWARSGQHVQIQAQGVEALVAFLQLPVAPETSTGI